MFAVRAAFDLLDIPGGEPVLLTGGATRSGTLTQLLADVLGRPVRPLGLRSASAVGAALVAGRGVGLDVDPVRGEGALVEPSGEPALERAFRRWSAA